MTGAWRSLDSSEITSSTLGGTLRPTMAHGGDHLSQLSLQLTSHKLTGKNYLEWAQSVKLAIDGRGKLGHLTGDVRQPAAGDPSLSAWRFENSLIMAWLINSMEPTIDGKLAILIVYVDDIILTGDDIVEMERLKQCLASEFEIKDLGSLKCFLGMEIARSRKGIAVSQRKYVLDLLKETGMSGCRPVETSIDPNQKLEDNKGDPVNTSRYQKQVGKLIYLSHTRPDIAFAVSLVSQFMHSPHEEHLEAVYCILRYLKSSPGKGLFFKKNEQRNLEAYTDADWEGSITDKKSTSGYCTFVWGNLVTWRSKKQSVVS
ncbi:hypothetical protein RJ639_030264 [Escallonia herrerae]|uniref:Retrovirus-related Pol polyprotein from transposon RE1 n=1 Tax=Escallonia herrerae TaxID=1293975 RepID=A0AA89BAI5_9ASTE|nr:hypothetical protein RJ639_030264 [Escallonia herrerae]